MRKFWFTSLTELKYSLVHWSFPKTPSSHFSCSLMNEDSSYICFWRSWKSIHDSVKFSTHAWCAYRAARRWVIWSRPPIFKRSRLAALSYVHTQSLRSLSNFKMESYRGWKRRIAIIFYIITFMTFVSLRYWTHENFSRLLVNFLLMHARIQLVSMERLVFDVFGQMWGTMLLNGLSTISLLAGLLAVCAAEKLAIALVSSVNHL